MKKIFILHGWTYTTDAWKQCVSELQTEGFEVVMLNIPGLTTPSDKIWTLDAYVQWLANTLKQEQEVVLLGHSNGGRIGIAYAATKPQPLRGLILIGSAGIIHNEFSLRLKRSVFGFIAKTGKSFARIPMLRKVFYKLIGARDYERAPLNMRETMKNLIKVDLVERLTSVGVPTLIIWGEKDSATPIGDAHILNAGITGSELKTIPNAGHSPHQSHSQEVAGFVSEWHRACTF